MNELDGYSLKDKLNATLKSEKRKYSKVTSAQSGQPCLVTLDATASSQILSEAHLDQLCLLLPTKNKSGDDENASNLERSDKVAAYVKVSQFAMSTDSKPQVAHMLKETPRVK